MASHAYSTPASVRDDLADAFPSEADIATMLADLADEPRPATRRPPRRRPVPSLYQRPVPYDFADEIPPGSPEPWHLVAAVRPDTPHVRALRVIDAIGEAAAGFVLIVGGAVAIGLATLL